MLYVLLKSGGNSLAKFLKLSIGLDLKAPTAKRNPVLRGVSNVFKYFWLAVLNTDEPYSALDRSLKKYNEH